MMNVFFAICISVASVVISSSLSVVFTRQGTKSNWYKCVEPQLSPPSVVYSIVWPILYVVLATVLTKSWMEGENTTIIIIYVNLILQAVWAFAYFGLKNVRLGMAVIICVLAASVALVLQQASPYWKVVLLFYVFWISFATFLNLMSFYKKMTSTCTLPLT